MFARHKGFVSIWIGQSLTQEAFERYAVHEGDLEVGPINGFAKDANDSWYDHDFVAAFCTGRKDQPLDVLMKDMSWANYAKQKMLDVANRKEIGFGNAIIALLDVELKPARWPSKSPLSFLGTFPYQLPKTEVPSAVKTKDSHRDLVWEVSFSPDGKFAISRDKNDFRLWNTTGRLVAKKNSDGSISQWLTDRTFLSETHLKRQGITVWKLGETTLACGKFLPTERYLRYCLTPDKQNVVWMKSLPVVVSLKKWSPADIPAAKIANEVLMMLPEGRLLTVDRNGEWKVWDVRNGQLLNTCPLKLLATNFHGAVSDNEIVAQVANGQQLVVNIHTGKIKKLKGPKRLDRSVVFKKRGQSFLAGSGGSNLRGTIRLWSLETGEVINDIAIDETNVVSAFAQAKGLAVTVSFHGNVTVWNLENGKQMAVLTTAPKTREVASLLEDGDGYELTCVDITPNAKKSIVGRADGQVMLFELQARKLVRLNA